MSEYRCQDCGKEFKKLFGLPRRERLRCRLMRKNRKWWEKKWWWVLCILLPLVLTPAINLFFFPEVPLSRSLIYAVAASFGVLVAYYAYRGKTPSKIQPKTLRRIIFIAFGAFTVGFLSWTFIVDMPGPIVLLLLFVLMDVCLILLLETCRGRREC